MTVYVPNLPALITALPSDHTRAPQTEFDRARQVLFLENLSVTGSVRSAACAAQVSHQTAYRARRATPAFRTAWDAALLVARAAAADTLACRAIDGVEEKVFYHGEEVATRTRYSDRLLLAHLGRLDRLTANERVNAFAEDFDAALARFERGEVAVPEVGEPSPEVPASAGTQTRSPAQAGVSGGSAQGEISSPGPCNTRSMSNTADEGDWEDGIDWEDEEAAAAELDRIRAAMAADRPADAPRLTGEGADDPHGLIADAQWQAFERKAPRWWLVVPPVPPLRSDAWRYAEAAAPSAPDAEADASDARGEGGAAPGNEQVQMREPQKPQVRASEPAPCEPLAPGLSARSEDGPRCRSWRPIDHGRLQPFVGRSFG